MSVQMTQRLEIRKISELVPYANNARVHSPAQIELLRRSLREYGFISPILIDGAGNVIAGHGRIEAAKLEGIEEAPCVLVEHLTDAQRRAYILADNRLAELSTWDEVARDSELLRLRGEGVDLTLTGFEDGEIVLGDAADADPDVHEDDFDEDPPEAPFTQLGQIWQLGRHRLMCGDATIADDVRDLMGGHRADVCFTSPPYNMGASMGGGWESAPNRALHAGAAYSDYSDNLADDDYADLLIRSVENALQYADDVMYNVGLLSKSRIGVIRMLAAHEKEFGDIVVWNKSQSMPFGMDSQRGLLGHRCEMIFCFNRRGTRSFSHPQWEKGCGINRIDTYNGSANKFADVHAATFPVEFAAAVIMNFTESSVLDLFGGTGTTMIAAEHLGRSCYMMELSPSYCDVIIRRWEALTGEKAVLLNG